MRSCAPRTVTAFDDRRVIQVALTPAGRRTLERQRMPQFSWVFTLLNGLDDDLRESHHVLEVIRRRLERHASNMSEAARAARGGADAISAASARRSRS